MSFLILVRIGGLLPGEEGKYNALKVDNFTVWMEIDLEMSEAIVIRMADYASDLPDRDLVVEGVF